MKLFTFFVFSAVLFSVAFAGPSRFHERPAARAERKSRSNAVISPSNSSNVVFSSNWAGVVLTTSPAIETFSTVTGTFTVPNITVNTGSVIIWVGIDGDNESQSILQSGVFLSFNDGILECFGWYEWYPGYITPVENFNGVSPGDVITVTVQSTNSTTGVATLINQSTGQSVVQSVSAPDSTAALQGLNAEWIVEDFEEYNEFVEFAKFTPVTFSDASASTGVETLSPIGGTIFEIEQNPGGILTLVTNNDDEIIITRV